MKKNKPRSLKEYIDYRNTLILRRKHRLEQGLKPLSGTEDYYTIRLRELDEQYPEFRGMGKITLKEGKK